MAHNYGNYPRPGSTTSFTGQPPPPPAYGSVQPYQSSTSPHAQSQWALPPPSQNPHNEQWCQPPQQQSWGQPPQQSQNSGPPGYNPGTYGMMGGYGQGIQPPPVPPRNPPQQQSSTSAYNSQYSSHQQDNPPPPPPKIGPGFQSGTQQYQSQNSQGWEQQPSYSSTQGPPGYPSQASITGFSQQSQTPGYNQHGQQGGYSGQHNPYQGQASQQQTYNNTAPPPPSQTPGGSYFPSAPRPDSVYGSHASGQYDAPCSATASNPPNSILSPNEQHPAYIPPSLTGQGVQSYVPNNTNPLPGVYVPPPPDIPAWQQAQHAPLQPGQKKFKYTKPIVDPSYQAGTPPGYQSGQQAYQQRSQSGQQQPSAPGYGNQSQPHAQVPQEHQRYGQTQQYGQIYQQAPYQQPQHFSQTPPLQQQSQQYPSQNGSNDYSSPPPYGNTSTAYQQPPVPAPYGNVNQTADQQAWQPQHGSRGSVSSQTHSQGGQNQSIEAPKPLHGQVQATQHQFFNTSAQSPESQPVSPISQRHNASFSAGQDHSALGRTGSINSVAAGRQPGQSGTPSQQTTTSPPDTIAASALGLGGPSDWEHFGAGMEEVDDEELFGAKKENKAPAPPPSDVMELQGSQPSPPPMTSSSSNVSLPEEWPTPPAPASLNFNRPSSGFQPSHRDNYQPTPPPNTSQPPPQSQGFEIDDESWTTQQDVRQSPPGNSGGFVVDEGGRATPTQASQNMAKEELERYKADAEKEKEGLIIEMTKLKAEFDQEKEQLRSEMTRLQVDTEGEKDKLRSQVTKLETEAENQIRQSSQEIDRLKSESEALKAEAQQLKTESVIKENNVKEKDALIAQLKMDIESKEKLIAEKDTIVQDLQRQLETPKDIAAPQPRDLVSDIDPWYAGSLERYIAMLRSEAGAPAFEDKVKVFTGFLAAESHVRGLEYYSNAPAAATPAETSTPQPVQTHDSASVSRESSTKKPNMTVPIPEQTFSAEPEEYSPGGRPILRRKQTLTSDSSIPTQRSFATPKLDENVPTSPIKTKADSLPQRAGSNSAYKPYRGSVAGACGEQSTQSTVILTPTSSTGDEFNRALQSPPEPPAEQSQPQYKPYTPSESTIAAPTSPIENRDHRQSLSFSVAPLQFGGKRDEIFFGASQSQQSNSKPSSRPATSSSHTKSFSSDVPMPAPLNLASTPSLTNSKSPAATLASILPSKVNAIPGSHPHLTAVQIRTESLPSDFAYIADLTKSWESSAAKTRQKLDSERRARQEESEARTDELFNDNEISYADIGTIEDEFKMAEREKKAAEDRDEYKSYVENVFDVVYDKLQDEIRILMQAFVETEILLKTSASGKAALELSASEDEPPTTPQAIQLLNKISSLVELRHEQVVRAVADRDKRYKKTEIQPLYAAGNISKMKNVERHFEAAERNAVLRAKGDKAERVAGLVRVLEEVVVGAVGKDQGYSEDIVKAIKNRDDNSVGDLELKKAGEVLFLLKNNSHDLMEAFNAIEIDLNTAVFDAEMAQVRAADKVDDGRIEALEKERMEGEKKLKVEFERRVKVLEEGFEESRRALEERETALESGPVETSEGGEGVGKAEREKQERLKAALKAAKRRNGEL